MTWPMCGAPTGDECDTCAETGRICYHDRDLNAAYEAAANELDDGNGLMVRINGLER